MDLTSIQAISATHKGPEFKNYEIYTEQGLYDIFSKHTNDRFKIYQSFENLKKDIDISVVKFYRENNLNKVADPSIYRNITVD